MKEISEYALSDRDRKKLENARVAMTRGNCEYAVELCSSLLSEEPGCLDARHMLRKAQTRSFASRSGSFRRYFSWIGNLLALAAGYSALRRNPARAMALGERVLSRDVYNAKALSLIARGAKKLELSRTEAFCLESICDRYPNNAVKLERLCDALIKIGSTEKALAVAERLAVLRPGSGYVRELVKSASVAHSINRGKWEEKGEDFRSKLKNKEESDSLERANRIATNEGSIEERIEELIQLIRQDPQLADNYKLLIRSCMALERYDDALEWLDKAVKLPQMELDASMRQLRSELKVNRVERELFDLKRSSIVGGASDDRIDNLESELLLLKLEESRKLVDQFPNDYSQRFKYGGRLLDAGEVDAAIQQFQISQRSPSLRLKSLLFLGKCFMGKSLFDLALDPLAQAVESQVAMDDFKKEALYLLARCYDKLGRETEAVDRYKIIYANDIGYKDVGRIIDAYYRDR